MMSISEDIEKAYERLTGSRLTDDSDNVKLTMDSELVKSTFLELFKKSDEKLQNNQLHIKELNKQLDEVKHSYTTLQAEYDSKFEKNKTISLNIPAGRKGLTASDEDPDSIKSFRPDSDDDSEDVRKREVELRKIKADEKVHNDHKHVHGRKCCHNHSHSHLYMDTHQQHYGL